MESSSTIRKMLAGNKIIVPTYQRAYSWVTPSENYYGKTQTDVFIADLEEYNKSLAKTPYYFGHFLFEEKSNNSFSVIDGQQRLTTIVIFLSALFAKLKTIRGLTLNESECFEDIIVRNVTYRFSTVDYDNQFFKDYVIDQTIRSNISLETESAKRIVLAFDYFKKCLATKNEEYLVKMLNSICEASCSTHLVKNESEAIQMFIFQNNRGIKPSNLEIIKAQFMYHVHLYGGDEKDTLIAEIKNRFEKIYKSISSIEYNINEDDVLVYTLRVYFNALWESDAIEKINKLLAENNPIPFIKSFTHSLSLSFEYLTRFFGEDERNNIEIHSLISLGGFSIAVPFIIKAYSFGLKISEICKLCASLEILVLRHRLIGTKAELASRLNVDYKEFTLEQPSIKSIIDRVNWMKNTPKESWWWAYWNTSELERSIQGGINHSLAKYLLWKYENHLEQNGNKGYAIKRFDDIISPELEHIAPQTPPDGETVATGYCEYDEEFINQFIDCLGNYLLLSKSHNCSVGNKPFSKKRSTYLHLAQQREIREMTSEKEIWNKGKITIRKEKIIKFILSNF